MTNKSIFITLALLADTYGTGSFGAALYSQSGSTQIGPLTLPVTGSTLLGISGAVLVAAAGGLFVYARQRRRKRLNQSV